MAKIALKAFRGIRPQVAPQLLDPIEAQIAENAKIYSGELRPWLNELKDADTNLSSLVRTIFKYRDDYWLEWSADVNVALGPISSDTTYRFYYTGDGIPKKSNFTMATTGAGAMPIEFLAMSVPIPSRVISATNNGGGAGDDRSVVWVWTAVTSWGEESAPSIASAVVTGLQGDSVDLSNMDFTWQASTTYQLNDYVIPTTPNGYMYICVQGGISGGSEPSWGTTIDQDTTDNAAVWRAYEYVISAKRIYRLNTGEATARYQFVAEITDTQTTYTDSKTDTELAEILRTGYGDYAYWSPPPQGLVGLVTLPGGIMAGFVGKDIYFCEPYYPHAWPEEYVLTLDQTVVALGVMENNLVAATEANPYIITGTHPESMTPVKMPTSLPCVSKRGLVSYPFGVLYPSTGGLVLVSEGRASVITDGFYRQKEWELVYPDTMLGAYHDSKYFGFFDDGSTSGKAIVVDFKNQYITTLNMEIAATTLYAPALYVDEKTDKLYYIKQTPEVFLLIGGTSYPSRTNTLRLIGDGGWLLLIGDL